MIDLEVARLRRLREVALRARAVARALAACRVGAGDPLFTRGRGAAWRVVRTVTGRLRAHPYAPFQRAAGLGVVLCNAAMAQSIVWSAAHRTGALRRLEGQLRALYRELADTRALTWAADLSEALGRSQAEIRILLGELQAAVEARPVNAAGFPIGGIAASAPHGKDTDWPFLAF